MDLVKTVVEEMELYEERAAIMEYDGGLPREEAEKLAWSIVCGDFKTD